MHLRVAHSEALSESYSRSIDLKSHQPRPKRAALTLYEGRHREDPSSTYSPIGDTQLLTTYLRTRPFLEIEDPLAEL